MISNDVIKELYPIQNIMDAHKKTKEYFINSWHNPLPLEEEIFCQFIMMQSFINLQYPPEVAYDYWEYLNSIMIAEIGHQQFNQFFEKKDLRFQEYREPYEKLRNTPFFEFGGEPQTDEEFSAISNFCSIVFKRVEKKDTFDNDKYLDFAQRCKSACAILMISMHLKSVDCNNEVLSETVFNEENLLSQEEYIYCIGTVLNDLQTFKMGDQLEMMIFAQYLTIRLAFQNGINPEKIIELMEIEDERMYAERGLPNDEIHSFLLKRFKRFGEYESDWSIFISGDWVKTNPFSFARHQIYGSNSLSFDIVLPFSSAVVSAIKQLQSVIGQLEDKVDEWNDEFLPLLEDLSNSHYN